MDLLVIAQLMGDEVSTERGKTHIGLAVSVEIDVYIIRIIADAIKLFLARFNACKHRILWINAKALGVIGRILQHVAAEPVVQED